MERADRFLIWRKSIDIRWKPICKKSLLLLLFLISHVKIDDKNRPPSSIVGDDDGVFIVQRIKSNVNDIICERKIRRCNVLGIYIESPWMDKVCVCTSHVVRIFRRFHIWWFRSVRHSVSLAFNTFHPHVDDIHTFILNILLCSLNTHFRLGLVYYFVQHTFSFHSAALRDDALAFRMSRAYTAISTDARSKGKNENLPDFGLAIQTFPRNMRMRF